MTDQIADFFAFARERHAIYLRRRASLPGPWTTDPILQQFSFTNVFRQLDRTTQWYTENVRKKLPPEQMLLATVVFRWFNRIRTGEAIFSQNLLDLMVSPSFGTDGLTAWEMLSVQSVDTKTWIDLLRVSILSYCGDGPYVTGAYIIKTPDGYSKLDGVLKCIEWFMEQQHAFRAGPLQRSDIDQQELCDFIVKYPGEFTLESVWDYLKKFPYLGDFMAYEIVTDLRWSIMDTAPDIMTWANPGPGATRGLGRVFCDNKDKFNQKRNKRDLILLMQLLLEVSRDAGHWPQEQDGWAYFSGPHLHDLPGPQTGAIEDDLLDGRDKWPAWEMRDVEHTLCEFDKYERTRTGEGRPRGRFHGGV